MSDSVTLPLKLALTGPMRRRTLAFISVSDGLLQRLAARNAGLQHGLVVQRRKDLSRGAAILYSPLISIWLLLLRRRRLPLAGIGVRRRFCQRFAQGDVDRREIRHRHQHRQGARTSRPGCSRTACGSPSGRRRRRRSRRRRRRSSLMAPSVTTMHDRPEDQQQRQDDFRQDRPHAAERPVHAHVARAAVVAQQAAERERLGPAVGARHRLRCAGWSVSSRPSARCSG